MQSVREVVQAKIEMRRRILADINKMSADETCSKSVSLQNQLALKLKSEDGVWAGFLSMKSEPQINWDQVSDQIQWCFPVLDNEKLIFKKSSSSYQKSSLGFNEPIDGEVVDLNQIRGVVVPGLAFDKLGRRLGRGRGFYDQTLNKYKGCVVGVCYQSSLVDEVPHEDHDLKCHFVITDEMSVAV